MAKIFKTLAAVAFLIISITIAIDVARDEPTIEQQRQRAAIEADEAELIQRLESGDPGTDEQIAELGERGVSRLDDMARQATGDEKIFAEVAAQMLRDTPHMNASYARAKEEFIAAGSFDIETAKSPEDFAERSVMVRDLLAQNDQAITFFRTFEERFHKQLIEAGMPAPAAERYAARMSESMNADLVVRIRELDTVAYNHALEFFDFVQKRSGTWEVDPQTQELLFETDEDVERYNDPLARINEAADKQIRLQHLLAQRRRP